MSSVTVTSKSDLEWAKNEGYDQIVVTGKLANDLKKSKQIAYAGAATISILVAAIAALPFTIAAAPFTAGLSTAVIGAGAVSVATLTGFEISAIIIAASLGVALIIAIFKDYEEISYSDGHLVLKKKST